MASALTAYKAWIQEADKATGPRHIQYLEMDITGANTDTAWDFATAAGTFWTAAEADETYGATATLARKLMYQIAEKAAYFAGVLGEVDLQYAREIAASGADYTMAAGTASNIPDLTFNSGNAPTSIKAVLRWVLSEDQTGIETVSS